LRRILKASIVATALVGAAYLALAYSPQSFNGAGPMRDTGLFSYPRYHAPLGEFSLHQPGEYHFSFGGLPDERMILMFYVSDFTLLESRDKLENLDTAISAKVSTSDGGTICWGLGVPSGREPNRWVLMSSRDRAAFWHSNCNGTQYERGVDYTLHVSIRDVDPNSPHTTLRAVLEGGGIELP